MALLRLNFLHRSKCTGLKERALSLLADFSGCLTNGDFTDRVEVYDDAMLIAYFHHKWPHEQHEPTAQNPSSSVDILTCTLERKFLSFWQGFGKGAGLKN